MVLKKKLKGYGKELIMDLHFCDVSKFNRCEITRYFDELCVLIDMKKGRPCIFWDYKGHPKEYKAAPPHLKGTSAVQFILTSSIVLHSLDLLKTVYINVFSCKDFDSVAVEKFTREYFSSTLVSVEEVERTL